MPRIQKLLYLLVWSQVSSKKTGTSLSTRKYRGCSRFKYTSIFINPYPMQSWEKVSKGHEKVLVTWTRLLIWLRKKRCFWDVFNLKISVLHHFGGQSSTLPKKKQTHTSTCVVVQSLSCVQLFVTPWTAAQQTSLFFTNSQSLLKLISIELVIPSNHLVLWHSLPSFSTDKYISGNEFKKLFWNHYREFRDLAKLFELWY